MQSRAGTQSEFSRIVDSGTIKVDEVAARYQRLTGIEIDVPMARTIHYLLWARIYYHQVKRNNSQGAEATAKKIVEHMERKN